MLCTRNAIQYKFTQIHKKSRQDAKKSAEMSGYLKEMEQVKICVSKKLENLFDFSFALCKENLIQLQIYCTLIDE